MQNNMKIAGVSAVLALAGAAGAQTSELYISSQGSGVIDVIQNGQLVRSFSMGSTNRSALAITASEVKALSHVQGFPGTGFDFNGNGNGANYAYNNPLFYEATTDGVNYIYAFDRNDQNAGFFRRDMNSQNPQQLFSLGNGIHHGVAFDSNGTVWGAQISGTLIRNFDLNGNVIASFNGPNGLDDHMILAFDRADNTLWLTDRGENGRIYQYDRSGNQLQSIQVQGWGGGNNILSGEFVVPAPTAAALLGLSGLAASRRRRA